MSLRKLIAAGAFTLSLHGTALAQDRPLLEPFRIGYAASDSIGERMRVSASLMQALRRKGFLLSWRKLESGVAAIRALDAEEIDLALDVSLPDVVVGKRENLKMVFIAELRSIAPSCCDQFELFADHIFKRYTLSSEYFANSREDVLLIVYQEIIRTLQQQPEQLVFRDRNLGPIPVTQVERQSAEPAGRLSLVTRESMEQVRKESRTSGDASASSIDITDLNYWMPQPP
jgi:hypothetical protein